NCNKNVIDECFWHCSHYSRELVFCSFDNFVVYVERRQRNRYILVHLNFNGISNVAFGFSGKGEGSRKGSARRDANHCLCTRECTDNLVSEERTEIVAKVVVPCFERLLNFHGVQVCGAIAKN